MSVPSVGGAFRPSEDYVVAGRWTFLSPVTFRSALIGAGGDTGQVSVRDYGAVGDGVTDDSAAINAAITAANAAGGGVVYLPKGTYLLRRPIFMKRFVILRGNGPFSGCRLKIADTVETALTADISAGTKVLSVASTAGFLVGQDVTIRDDAHVEYASADSDRIAAIGASTLTLEKTLKSAYTVAQLARVFTAFGAVSFERATYFDGLGVPVASAGVTDAGVEDLEIDGNGANQSQGNKDDVQGGVQFSNAHRSFVRRCYIHDTMLGGVMASHYIDGAYDGTEDAVIENNWIVNAGYRDSIHMHGTKRSRVTGNLITGGSSTAIFQSAGVYAILCNDLVIGDNVMTDSPRGVTIIEAHHLIVRGNVIKNATYRGIDLTTGATPTAFVQIIGNNINVCGQEGIVTKGSAHVVSQNVIDSPGNIGIHCDSARTVVSHNTVNTTAGSSGIVTNTNAAGSSVVGNTVQKTGFGNAIHNLVANVTISGNTVTGTAVAITNSGAGVVIVGNAGNTSHVTPIVNTGTAAVANNANNGALL